MRGKGRGRRQFCRGRRAGVGRRAARSLGCWTYTVEGNGRIGQDHEVHQVSAYSPHKEHPINPVLGLTL